jgi:hypothetical protein
MIANKTTAIQQATAKTGEEARTGPQRFGSNPKLKDNTGLGRPGWGTVFQPVQTPLPNKGFSAPPSAAPRRDQPEAV